MELGKNVLQDVASLLDNKRAMQKLQRYVRKLKKEIIEEEKNKVATSPIQYTVEEMKNVLKESETDFNTGNTHTSKEVFNEIEKEFPWLCK